MRLINANEILKSEHQHLDYMADEYYVLVRDIENAPTVDAEPTEEQVKEYCRKRCLVIVNSELFNEMKARWSAEPVVWIPITARPMDTEERLEWSEKLGYDIDKKKIEVPAIKTLGVYTCKLKLYQGVSANIKVDVQ